MQLSERTELIKALKNGTVTVTFYKKDGSVRVMPCTLNPVVLDANGIEALPTDYIQLSSCTSVWDQIPVWDTEHSGWRSFLDGQVISWEVL